MKIKRVDNLTNPSKIKKLQEEIKTLKEEENALILAHNYVDINVQEIADAVGDSLFLAKIAREKAEEFDYIIQAAVTFMAETAVIINPEKDVYIAGEEAYCPMARMCPAEVIDRYKEKYPNLPVVLYVNTTAAAKAKADVMCTSSNAVNICKKMNNQKLLFGPDRNLGNWVRKQSDIDIISIPDNGHCYVHKMFKSKHIQKIKDTHPDAISLAHPECDIEVLNNVDVVGSTKTMYDYCGDSNEKEFIIATEKGLINRLNKDFGPDKKFYPAFNKAICKGMKNNTLENILKILLNRPESYKVTLDSDIIQKAKVGINKMFELMKK
ncbi:MAG: quinolinate synthase NadA [Candidatus Lokiarchaeota archaeon]|nr:quinolinate synthase NadA [Candidatus Lokiarchaeota archaeon]